MSANTTSRRAILQGGLALTGLFVLDRALGVRDTRVRAAPPELVWPLSGTTVPDVLNSPFGPRLRASAGYTYDFHGGIDLAAPLGTPVHAVADGTVRLLTDATGRRITSANSTADPSGRVLYPNGGMAIQLDHGGSIYSTYQHMSGQAHGLATTQLVRRGDVIGFVGHSGTASYDHLHFDMRAGSYYQRDTVNPLGYLPNPNDRSPRITGASALPAKRQAEVAVSLACDREDLNLNQVAVTSYDRRGRLLDEVAVDFDQRVNCGADVALTGRVLLEPARFNRHSAGYRLDVTIVRLRVSRGGRIVIRAQDVGGAHEATTGLNT